MIFLIVTIIGCTWITLYCKRKVRQALKAKQIVKDLEPLNAMLDKYHKEATKCMERGDMHAMENALDCYRTIKLKIINKVGNYA